MDFPDKFNLTKDLNRRFVKQNMTKLVHTNARFEGINTTMPQTQTIMDGLGVDGVPIDDINTIVRLKHGWEYIVNNDDAVDLDLAKKLNKIVAEHQSLDPGNFRSGSGYVDAGGKEFIPPTVDEQAERNFLKKLSDNPNMSTTDKAMTLMYHLMRNQIFWDGNKRTAILLANKMMIDHGAGVINVPLNHWPKWNELISDYYFTNNMDKIKKWTYSIGIQGVELQKDRKLEKTNSKNKLPQDKDTNTFFTRKKERGSHFNI